MRRTWIYLVFLLSLLEGLSALNADCPNCELCPLESPGCCFLSNGTMKENGEIIYDSRCVTVTCVDGKEVKESYCPPGFINIGFGCYYIGNQPMMFPDAEQFCRNLGQGSGLADLQDELEAVALEGEIEKYLPDSARTSGLGTVWLGVEYWSSTRDFYWIYSGEKVSNGYTNFANKPTGDISWLRVSAYSVKNGDTDYRWYYERKSSRLLPFCETRECTREQTCIYEGREYRIGEVILRDPNCKCSWIECGSDGQVKAVNKIKPCCEFNGNVYSNYETIRIEKCYKLQCLDGALVSYPYCEGDYHYYYSQFYTVKYGDSFSCYHYSNRYYNHQFYTFEQAAQYCARLDSKLAEITSPEEQYALEEFLAQYNPHGSEHGYWIGGKAETCNGRLGPLHWTSADTQYLPVESIYEDYCAGYPNNETEDQCLYMTFTRFFWPDRSCWRNSQCHERRLALCEKCAECEHKHLSGSCFRPYGQIYTNGTIINSWTSNNVCYEELCIDGKIQKKQFLCQNTPSQQGLRNIEAADNEEEDQS